MARIHRRSVMFYGSPLAEFMGTKYNSHIHSCGTSIFGKIVVKISKSIDNNNRIFRRLYNIIIFDIPRIFLSRNQDFFSFCSIPCFINSCMGEVQVGVIYDTLLDSNDMNPSLHASQKIYFF